MNELTPEEEKQFKAWYDSLSRYKGLDPDPNPSKHFYDYRGYWKENKTEAQKMLSGDPEAHFPDTYKLPGHPTFSVESKYSTKENPGGRWEGEKFIPPNMTIEEYNKKKQELYDAIRSGKISEDEASTRMVELAMDHPSKGGSPLQEMTEFIQNFPATAQSMSRLQAQAQAGQLQDKVAAGLKVLADAGMFAASVGQITAGNRAADRLQKPGLPAVPGYNPQLTQALYEAQRGVMNPNAVLQPAIQQNQQAYLGAQQANQIASGGQAGSLQALNQVANLQRMQGNLGLAPIAQDVRNQNFQNQAQLFGQRLGETQNMFQNRAGVSDSAFDRYRFASQAAGLVGSSGRQNLMDATQRLAYHLGQVPMGTETAPAWAQNAGFDSQTDNQMRNIYAERALRSGGYQNRGYLQNSGYGSPPAWMNQRAFYQGFAPNIYKPK